MRARTVGGPPPKSNVLRFDPSRRQPSASFEPGHRADVITLVPRPKDVSSDDAHRAYSLYVEASRIDEDPSTYDLAEQLYGRAVALDPQLAIAYVNLGNIRWRRGAETEALDLYKQALRIDARQPDALYNVGYVLLERGDARAAAEYFERALKGDPRFGDAHFNLAMAYEQVGESAKARPHWKRYLEIEPTGTWADVAREHLDPGHATPKKPGRQRRYDRAAVVAETSTAPDVRPHPTTDAESAPFGEKTLPGMEQWLSKARRP